MSMIKNLSDMFILMSNFFSFLEECHVLTCTFQYTFLCESKIELENLEKMHVFQIKLVDILKNLLLRFETFSNVATNSSSGITESFKTKQTDLWAEELNLNSTYERDVERVDASSDLNNSAWLDISTNNSLTSIPQNGSTHLNNELERSSHSTCVMPQVCLEDIVDIVDEKPFEEKNVNTDTPSILKDLVPFFKTDVSLKIEKDENGFFTCNICGKSFKNKKSSLRHIKRHAERKKFSCKSCNKRFAVKVSLDAHMLRKHGVNTTAALSCSTCGKQFLRLSSLKQHMVIHQQDKPFQCEICDKVFSQKVSRDIHVLWHTGQYNFKCTTCGKIYPNKSKLKAHEYIHKEPRFECHICGSKFKLHSCLRVHMNIHLEVKPYQCALCTKSFASKGDRDKHEQAHKGVKFVCLICGASFGWKSSLTNHEKKHSNELKFPNLPAPTGTFSCSTCGKGFSTKRGVKKHEKLHQIPPGVCREKLHQCNVCGKKFLHKDKLKQHVKTHFEEPSFVCVVCGKGFYRKDVLKSHLLIHNGHRQFCCDHCGKAFTFKPNLRVHMAMHIGNSLRIMCDICGKKFKHKSSYNIHRKSHFGEYNHMCATCGKKFITKSHYESHIRTHQIDRPYTCPTCGKDYKEQKHCREHIKRVHPNDFNLDSLFTSITSEDAHMSSLLCSDQAEKLVMEHSQQQQVPLHIGLEQLKHEPHQTDQVSQLKYEPHQTDQLSQLKYEPHQTDQVSQLEYEPHQTDQVSQLKYKPHQTDQVSQLEYEPHQTDQVLQLKYEPHQTDQVSQLKYELHQTDQVSQLKYEPHQTDQVSHLKYEPHQTDQVSQLKHEPHQTDQVSQLQYTTLHPSMNIQSGLMVDQPSLLLLDTVQTSNIFSSNPFCGLEPILQDVNLSQPSNYFSHSLNTHNLTQSINSIQCPVSVVSGHGQFMILSAEDTTSALSQSLQILNNT